MTDWQGLPPLTALRAFAAFAEAGNMAAAGAALNVSHAAISQQIRALEDDLNVALVDRTGRRAELTEEGRALSDALVEGFGAIGRAVDALTGRDAARPLQVTATPTFAANWLMPRLAGFRAAYPDVGLMIDASAAVQPLGPGGIDLALRYGSGDWPGLEATLLVESAIVVVAAPALLGDARISAPDQLADFPWLQELGSNEASHWLLEHGVNRSAGFGMTELPGNLMLEGARLGQGVAITAEVSVTSDIAAGRLRVLFRDDQRDGYWIVTRPGVQRPALKALIRWLKAEASREATSR